MRSLAQRHAVANDEAYFRLKPGTLLPDLQILRNADERGR